MYIQIDFPDIKIDLGTSDSVFDGISRTLNITFHAKEVETKDGKEQQKEGI